MQNTIRLWKIVCLIIIQILVTAKQYWKLRERTEKSKQITQKMVLHLP